ncbi:hypothetical protein [Paenibacillus sacheonensis]|uniref:Polymerase beta nucleotidyltransferase domain-containing protein n=1 Tax=Paenibacillus sacheonensis TaxID=742054 RepID=A0A7X4YJJ0_9BACL|nr:hypothetical protein [Paenibacillus sacheonensis]MBM7564224.1 hypothetical protein [Paenibacillus sacheonensis]NBC67453.1 hypothetical protein [Paenibacillus sacheonensis]
MNDIQATYRAALESVTEQLRQDNRVLAAFVLGSLSYDVVWEKSDIDMMIVVDDDKRPSVSMALVEQGICISAWVVNRQQFKTNLERSMQTSFFHSFLSKGTLLFCSDASIRDLYERVRHVGERDLDVQLLINASIVVTLLEKAEKWLVVKKDPTYSFLWILKTVEELARVEVMLNRDIPTREVIQQALKYNPAFFGRMYTELIEGPKTLEAMEEAVRLADRYVEERHERLFKLVTDYLSQENDVRPFSELMLHLKQRYRMDDALIVHGCEWLAQKGFIERASYPARLTARSRVELDELAYFDSRRFGR